MSKNLMERLDSAKVALGKIDGALARHASLLPTEVEHQFKTIAAFGSHVDHWTEMYTARETARALLTDLENHADHNDDVPYGSSRAKFQTVRLLGVQAYLAAQWAMADRLVGMAGHVLCIRNQLQDPKSVPQLVSHFVGGKGPESKTVAMLTLS